MKIHLTPQGLLAEFASPADLTHACERIRDAGYQKWDAHTPFPVHGLDKAMGLKPSVLPWIVFVMGLTGAIGAMTLQWWIHAVDFPLVISGKPFFSWQAFVPVTFEVMVLFSSLGAFFGMLGLNQLPRLYHPIFATKTFNKASDDGFFVSIDATDAKFDETRTTEFLKKAGALHIESIEEETTDEE